MCAPRHGLTNSVLQVATDSLTAMERAMSRDGIVTNDRQLACARINSPEGQDYLVRSTSAPYKRNAPQARIRCS